MRELLLLLPDGHLAQQVIGALKERGGRVLQRYGSRVIVAAGGRDLRSELAQSGPPGVEIFIGSVPQSRIPTGDASAELGVLAWNERHSTKFVQGKANRPGAGLSWGNPNFEREGGDEE